MADRDQRTWPHTVREPESQASVPIVRFILSGILAAAAIAGMLLTIAG